MDDGAGSYQRYLEGDESGLEQIVEMYGKSLTLFINRLVGDMGAAEELMEDTFCELIIHKRQFKEKATFKTYLFRIARNKAVDYVRKRSRIVLRPTEEIRRDDFLQGFENSLIQDEQKKALQHSMAGLSRDYQIALYLVYYESMSYSDAAHVMRKNARQVKNLVYRAKQSLKTALEKEGFEYEEQ